MIRLLAPFCLFVYAINLNAQDKTTAAQYIERYKWIAVAEMHRTGIPASIKMSQGLLESGNGNSRLAREGNNHFGIKCKKTWTGKTIIEDDDEANECFRAYDSAYQSYMDHSAFLLGNTRYAFLFDYSKTDYKNWAYGLKQAGYATNPKYPELLISVIERHQLNKLDELTLEQLQASGQLITPEVAANTPASEDVFDFNKIPATRVAVGDNVNTIAKKHEMGAWQVRRYNDLDKDQTLSPGEVIYLKPKRRRGSAPYHVVKEGETMWSIAQLYGIKEKHLYRKNQLNRKAEEQPQAGQTLYLQEKNPDKVAVATEPIIEEKKLYAPPIQAPADTAKAKPVAPKPLLSPQPILSSKEAKDTAISPTQKETGDKAIDFHTVKTGETLFAISKMYQVSVEEIKQLNNLNNYQIAVGQQLVVNARIKINEANASTPHYVHEVKAGETLFGIAKLYNMSVDELKQLNQLTSNELKMGQKLQLNQAPKGSPDIETDKKPVEHKVKAGDTLFSIARHYQISVSELKRLNNLSTDQISPGQLLKLQ